jgi:hypothetical protein
VSLAHAYTEGGIASDDTLLLTETVDLFDTHDARNAIRTFLDEGPGMATFAGH